MSDTAIVILCVFFVLGVPALALAFIAWLERYTATTAALRRRTVGGEEHPHD